MMKMKRTCKIEVPFKVPRAAEARACASKSYWDAAKRLVESPEYQRAARAFLRAMSVRTSGTKRT